jgi:nucleotide-binding universal stress UspA family protein
MYERILVPLDGSDLAEAVLPHVEPIAEKFGAEVILLQITSPYSEIMRQTMPSGSLVSPTEQEVSIDIAKQQHEIIQAHAQTYLEKMRESLSKKGIRAVIDVREGPAAAGVILAVALDLGCELIAMSTHGRTGLGRTVFGSVADEVLRNSPLPVLLIRSGS